MKPRLKAASTIPIALPFLAMAQDQRTWTVEFEVVVCVTAGAEPWRMIDRGTLKRNRFEYLLVAGGRSIRWHLGGDSIGAGAPSLRHYIERYVELPPKQFAFPPDPMPGTAMPGGPLPGRAEIVMKPSGEVMELLGPFTIATFIATECPPR